MDELSKMHDKIEEFLNSVKGNLQIMEEEIDIEKQVEYFDLVKNNQEKKTFENLEKEQWIIEESSEEKFEEQKQYVVALAKTKTIKAYRLLEKIIEQLPQEAAIRPYCVLALQDLKMHLHSEFMDESQVFISTGLGGKGNRLRYFLVISSKDKSSLEEWQQNLIKKEFEFQFKNKESELESIDFSVYYATIKTLIPLHIDIDQLLKKCIEECNLMGNFVDENYLITNVRVLTAEEIEKVLNNKSLEHPLDDSE